MMSKYDSLWKYVAEQKNDKIKLSFDEIGQISGVEFNHSFLNCKKELLAYGWKVGKISMKEKTVIFEKKIELENISKSELICALQDKDDKKAYDLSKEILEMSAFSDKYYSYFEEFVSLLTSKSSYVRTRGFQLCCAQARWDKEGKLKKALPTLFALLHDEKPTAVRGCLGTLHEVVLYQPELCEIIKEELLTIDLSKYKDSMAPLIKKDMDALLKVMD